MSKLIRWGISTTDTKRCHHILLTGAARHCMGEDYRGDWTEN